ncbi:MAG: hypothetical protein AAF728_03600 [Cyanobacteria bacterium P01_D01_bin.128]
MKGLIPYVVAGIAIASVAVAQTAPTPQSAPDIAPQTSEDDGPTRLTISVAVTDPEDLKVEQGDRVSQGQLIADRTRERERLEAQQAKLQLTIERLEGATITAPLPPMTASPILEPTYLEENAAIARAEATVDQAEAAITAKQQEITYLSALASLDPLVMEHEQVKLAELQREHTAAVRDYQLARGKQSTTEYRHSVTLAESVGSRNRAALEYQQQWAHYEQRLRDRDYQLSQVQLQLEGVENAIAALSVVRSPYDGRIRQVKWLGQGPDGAINVELTLLVRAGDGAAAPVSGEQPGMPDGINDAGDIEQQRD